MTLQESHLPLWFDSNCMTNKRSNRRGRSRAQSEYCIMHSLWKITKQKLSTSENGESRRTVQTLDAVARENKQDEGLHGAQCTVHNALDCSSINPKGSLQNCPTVSLPPSLTTPVSVYLSPPPSLSGKCQMLVS